MDVASKNWQSAKASDLGKFSVVVATKGLFSDRAKAGYKVEVTGAKTITLLKFPDYPKGLFSSVLKVKIAATSLKCLKTRDSCDLDRTGATWRRLDSETRFLATLEACCAKGW